MREDEKNSPPRLPASGLLRRLGVIGRETVRAYFTDNISRLGAALAFYTTVAVAPMLMLAILGAGIFFHENAARQRVLGEIHQLAGADATRALQAVEPPLGRHTAAAAAWFSAAVFAFGGFGVFTHLQSALNDIWHAPKHPDEPWAVMIKRRLFSFGTVVGTSFIMLVSLILSAALTWLGEHATRWADWPPVFWQGLNFVFSFGVITFLFAMMFKLLPDVPVRWRDVWVGAALTALLFDAGKTGLALYLAHTRIISSYGAASSIVALLLWCYYAGQIFLIGAEFTRIQAETRGGRIAPGSG